MAPAILDEACFDRFLSDNETAVIGFIEKDGNAATFTALVSDVLGKHPGVAFAQVHGNSRKLFEMFGLSGTATAIFRGRVGMYLEAGLPAADQLSRLLDGVALIDMERVRAEVEQERSARESLAVHRVCPATRRGKLE
ncbi:MAG TPA: hypothetical protein VJT81_17735 [Burkholderiales bacterium]|nr:hypothetical protein [Burkholderiales bacterium]